MTGVLRAPAVYSVKVRAGDLDQQGKDSRFRLALAVTALAIAMVRCNALKTHRICVPY